MHAAQAAGSTVHTVVPFLFSDPPCPCLRYPFAPAVWHHLLGPHVCECSAEEASGLKEHKG